MDLHGREQMKLPEVELPSEKVVVHGDGDIFFKIET